MQRTSFGELPDGRAIAAFRLGRERDFSATVLTYGARLAAVDVAVDGGMQNVVLGHADLAGYVADTAYLGAVVGRYGNRIRDGRFPLGDRVVQVSVNNGPNMLHGGKVGFDRAVWHADTEGETLLLHHTSPDGDQGFPGTLHAEVRYAIEGDALIVDYRARCDAETVLNLTNHAYWNLAGAGDVLDHVVTLHADRYTPVDDTLIPTGVLALVNGTPFDFRTPHRVGERIGADDEQLRRANGYDHNMVLADAPRATPQPAATVEAAGLRLEVATTEPGLQFYSGNFLPEAGWPLRAALCLETQHFPDSPNHPAFPTTLLRPGETFHSRTMFRLTAS